MAPSIPVFNTNGYCPGKVNDIFEEEAIPNFIRKLGQSLGDTAPLSVASQSLINLNK